MVSPLLENGVIVNPGKYLGNEAVLDRPVERHGGDSGVCDGHWNRGVT
jgi:hypothetical protein